MMVLFILSAADRYGRFHVTGPDGKAYGPCGSLGPVLPDIARDYPLDTVINFRWDYSKAISFNDTTLESWLRSTAPARGVKKEDRDKEIDSYRNLHGVHWG
ncbi:MAG: hypothetical protein LPK02_07205 [Rhodobacterales bacterium]|nr:hypothetical protein [Rhodobacterales bacterium]